METDKKRSPASSTRTAHDSDEIPRVHSDEVDIEMRTWHPEKAIAVAEGVTAAAEAIAPTPVEASEEAPAAAESKDEQSTSKDATSTVIAAAAAQAVPTATI